MKLAIAAAAVLCGLASAKNIDECSMYSDSCMDCLNITSGTYGHRDNCGWCHGGVTYHDGSQGPQCVDKRDFGPDGKGWQCQHSTYENFHCPAFYDCNHTTGQCYPDPTPGGGLYPSKTLCNESCTKTPKPKQLYECNVSNPAKYTCDVCKQGAGGSQAHCGSKEDACKLCKAPPPRKYKCNMTEHPPKCAACLDNQTEGCGPQGTACAMCNQHRNQSRFTCNMTTFKCEKSNSSSSGLPQSACNSSCSNSTPSELVNSVWRGIEAERGYVKGEFDLSFTKQQFKFKGPNGLTMSGHVSTDFEGTTLHVTSASQTSDVGHFYRVNKRDIDETAPETLIAAFLFGKLDGTAPQSLQQAMDGQPAGSKVYLMAKCKNNGGDLDADKKCDFSPVFPPTSAAARRRLLAQDTQENFVLKAIGAEPSYQPAELWESDHGDNDDADADPKGDPCNIYTDCHDCISAKVSGYTCGWCIGAAVVYNSSSMPKGAKCAGTPATGVIPFTCPKKFSTENCEAYKCDWGSTPVKCNQDDSGEGYPTMQACETEGQCNSNSSKLKKCDYKQKKCVDCKAGEKGCDTAAHCAAEQCSTKTYAKCDVSTKQCKPCTPSHDGDANCSMSTEECSKICAKTDFGICDPATGKCHPCKNSSGHSGCVNGCSDSCKPHPPKPSGKALCNYTTYQCQPSNKSWAPSKAECEKNCKEVTYSKCNTTTGKCDKCKQGEPDCKYTTPECQSQCKKATPLTGVYRGIEISKGFHVGEWDFDFTQQTTAKITFTPNDGSSGQVFAATPTAGSPASGGLSQIALKFTTAPANNYLNVASGDTLNGIFKKEDGQYHIFEVVHLATANKPSAPAPASFDAAMTDGFVFDLYGCKTDGKGTGSCDFQAAGEERNPWATSMRIN